MPTGITIIGLGPGDSQTWTQAAATLLNQAGEVYLRTAHYPGLAAIPALTYSFDTLFESIDDLDQANNRLAAELVRLGQREPGVVYAAPGHPALDEPALPRIRALAEAQNLPLILVPGLSLLETARAALNLVTARPLQVVEAVEIARLHHPPLSPDSPTLALHLTPRLAVKVKQTLLNAYPADFIITLLHFTETAGQVSTCRLADLDSQPCLNLQTILYLPADPANTSFVTLQETIAHLRAPDGCPWDQKQTHQSLRPFLLEETYEVLETLDAHDPVALAEELGDLLLQIVLHAQVATDTGEFKMGELIGHIQRKLVRRHPHVFDSVVVNDAGEVVVNWEAIKRTEKEAKGQIPTTPSALDGILPSLPALAQALAISQKAVRVGFEWPAIEGVLDKVIEEAREITLATSPDQLEAEIGDLLFCVVNLARWHHLDPESALRAMNARFTRRFKRMEALVAARGQTLAEISPAEKRIFWNEAKSYEG